MRHLSLASALALLLVASLAACDAQRERAAPRPSSGPGALAIGPASAGSPPTRETTPGWDGERAWIMPDAAAFPSPARFWALTPYYFVGMPFVAADPGTRYERLADAALDGVTYQLVKLTYGDGVGDAPDDYDILYLHPETHLLAGLRYVVSYPGFFPQGGHTPEKLMRYTDYASVDGLLFAQRPDTAGWELEAGVPGEVVTEIRVARVALGERFAPDLFAPPEGAVIAPSSSAN